MKYLYLILIGFTLINCQSPSSKTATVEKEPTVQKATFKTTGSIEQMADDMNDLIAKDAQIEVIAEGFTWSEGPLWIDNGQYLLFSDIPPNRVMKWSEKDGLSLYLNPSGYTGKESRTGEPGSNGLLLNPDGHLVLCQHGDRRIAKMTTDLANPTAQFETIIDKYDGKRFNSPNDAIYDSQGNLYFTDPPYGLEKNMKDPAKEIDFQGVYRYSKDGQLSLLSDKITRPNGLGLSPDEKTLYVACSDPAAKTLTAFTLDEAGGVINERLFYDATSDEEQGLPDGLKVDKKGNVWATGPGGVWIFNPKGEVLGRIRTGEKTSNCAFDTNQEMLYMTCDDYLMRLKLK